MIVATEIAETTDTWVKAIAEAGMRAAEVFARGRQVVERAKSRAPALELARLGFGQIEA